jgi:hypothetical protein
VVSRPARTAQTRPREWRVSFLDHLLAIGDAVSFITWNLTTGVDEGWTTTEVKAHRAMTIIAFCFSWVRLR